MTRRRIVPLVLAGGSGARLWPVSREAMPKQFLALTGTRSTYQQALARVSDEQCFAPPIVMTNAEFRFFTREQAEETGCSATIVLEPLPRDSAPAIAAGVAIARRRDPEAVMLTLAADHVILDPELFQHACNIGRKAADEGYIVTFGIRPSVPKNELWVHSARRGPALRRRLSSRCIRGKARRVHIAGSQPR